MVLHDMQAPLQSEQLQYYSPFLGHLWRTLVKENYSKANLSMASAECSNCQQQRPTLGPHTWYHSPGRTKWLHWITSIMEGAVFCSYWNKHLLWLHINLICTQCLYIFWIFHINGTLQYVVSRVWLFSLSMFLKFLHVVPCIIVRYLRHIYE